MQLNEQETSSIVDEILGKFKDEDSELWSDDTDLNVTINFTDDDQLDLQHWINTNEIEKEVIIKIEDKDNDGHDDEKDDDDDEDEEDNDDDVGVSSASTSRASPSSTTINPTHLLTAQSYLFPDRQHNSNPLLSMMISSNQLYNHNDFNPYNNVINSVLEAQPQPNENVGTSINASTGTVNTQLPTPPSSESSYSANSQHLYHTNQIGIYSTSNPVISSDGVEIEIDMPDNDGEYRDDGDKEEEEEEEEEEDDEDFRTATSRRQQQHHHHQQQIQPVQLPDYDDSMKRGKRINIQYPIQSIYRAQNYVKTIDNINSHKFKVYGRDVKFQSGTNFVTIGHREYRIVPENDWKINYMMYMMPNRYINSESITKYQRSLGINDGWIYYDNANDQPHFCLNVTKLPFRYCEQVGNFYEPFIIREKSKDGRILTKFEIRERSERRIKGKSKDDSLYFIEALCPYCPVSYNKVTKFDDFFYGRNNSDYLHHITKHHGVYSDGSEHPLPDLIVVDNKKKYYAHCQECQDLIKIKDPTGNQIVGNRFLGYLRHCLKHKNKCKNGGGLTRLQRRQNVMENAQVESLLYENGETGQLLV